MKQLKIRELHRDLGYFYIGLIISFALSGILMNHRDSFHAEKYTTETRLVVVKVPQESEVTDEYAEELGKKLGIDDKFRRQKMDLSLIHI